MDKPQSYTQAGSTSLLLLFNLLQGLTCNWKVCSSPTSHCPGSLCKLEWLKPTVFTVLGVKMILPHTGIITGVAHTLKKLPFLSCLQVWLVVLVDMSVEPSLSVSVCWTVCAGDRTSELYLQTNKTQGSSVLSTRGALWRQKWFEKAVIAALLICHPPNTSEEMNGGCVTRGKKDRSYNSQNTSSWPVQPSQLLWHVRCLINWVCLIKIVLLTAVSKVTNKLWTWNMFSV